MGVIDGPSSELSGTPSAQEIREQVAALEWYHTMELAPGVLTPGWLDHRTVAARVPFPPLQGLRCLDVGTFNGFWAFEMERRGAREVIGIDVLDPYVWEWPADSEQSTIHAIARRTARGDGFELARRCLRSSVTRLDLSVYDLDPAQTGTFDVVYLGSLLIHLRDPVRALASIRRVCSGTLIVVDGIDLPLTLRSPRLPVARLDARGRPWWWYPNAAGLRRMIEAAGFEVIHGPQRLFVPAGRGWQIPRWDPRPLRNREGRYALTVSWLGDPHAIVVARPHRGR
jgi:tRNA (mo5U34)-methyltransferase